MSNVQKYVSYVVGTLLVFPLRVIHILPFEEKIERKKVSEKPQANKMPSSAPASMRTQQGVKRTSGQAQKNVRVKHKQLKRIRQN